MASDDALAWHDPKLLVADRFFAAQGELRRRVIASGADLRNVMLVSRELPVEGDVLRHSVTWYAPRLGEPPAPNYPLLRLVQRGRVVTIDVLDEPEV